MASFPSDFADLEPFAGWALPTEKARYAKRLSSTMDELQGFYDAAFPRMEAAATYLEQFDMDALPDDAERLLAPNGIQGVLELHHHAERLLWLYCSLVTVSFPVEVWRQPRVPDSGSCSLDAVAEPAV